nr:hypothetical protein PsAHV6-065 [Psittacid alphaherpesvirus 6]
MAYNVRVVYSRSKGGGVFLIVYIYVLVSLPPLPFKTSRLFQIRINLACHLML